MAPNRQRPFPFEVERALVRAILEDTKFQNNFYELKENMPLLSQYGLSQRVYCSISPEIKLYGADGESRLDYTIDLRDHAEGDPNCDHDMLPLYWETGGGCMDDGTPHSYLMCRKCGYHRSHRPKFLQSLEPISIPSSFPIHAFLATLVVCVALVSGAVVLVARSANC